MLLTMVNYQYFVSISEHIVIQMQLYWILGSKRQHVSRMCLRQLFFNRVLYNCFNTGHLTRVLPLTLIYMLNQYMYDIQTIDLHQIFRCINTAREICPSSDVEFRITIPASILVTDPCCTTLNKSLCNNIVMNIDLRLIFRRRRGGSQWPPRNFIISLLITYSQSPPLHGSNIADKV